MVFGPYRLYMATATLCSLLQGTYAGQFVMEGFLNLHWARWKRVLLTRSVAMVPCVIIAILAVNSLDYLDEYINVEQSMLVRLRYLMYNVGINLHMYIYV